MGTLLIPALISVTAMSLLVAALYLYLYVQKHDRLLFLWGAAWGVYSLRFVIQVGLVLRLLPSWMVLGQEAASLVGALLCLVGANAFSGRSTGRGWYYGAMASFVWVAMAWGAGLPFFWADLPGAIYVGLLFGWAGYLILRHAAIPGAGKMLAGVALVLWGVHKANHPFLRPVEWFAPWGFLIASLLFFAVAIGVLLLYFDSLRCDLEQQIEAKDKAQALLAESEQQFRAIFNEVNDGILLLEPKQYSIVDANAKAVEMFGYKRDEMLRLDIEALSAAILPHLQGEVAALMKRTASGDAQCFEWQGKDKGGRVFWVEINMRMAVVGGANRLIFCVRDVAARKEVESLREQALLDLGLRVVEQSGIAECARVVLEGGSFSNTARRIFDTARRLTGGRSGYVALLDANGVENQVLFLEAGGLSCSVDPSLPMPVRGLRAEAYVSGRAVVDNDFMNSQWAAFMPAGHVQLRNVLFAPLNIDGRTVGIMGIANKPEDFTQDDLRIAETLGHMAAIALRNNRNLDAMSESRQYLLTVLDAVPAVVYHKDREGRFRNVNRAWSELFGLEADSVIGKTAGEVGAMELCGELFRGDDDVVRSGQGSFGVLAEIRMEEGERWFLTDKIPYRSVDRAKSGKAMGKVYRTDEGLVDGVIGFCLDITERHRAEVLSGRRLTELQRWHDLMLDREDRVQELKREVNVLCLQLGTTLRYHSQVVGSAADFGDIHEEEKAQRVGGGQA